METKGPTPMLILIKCGVGYYWTTFSSVFYVYCPLSFSLPHCLHFCLNTSFSFALSLSHLFSTMPQSTASGIVMVCSMYKTINLMFNISFKNNSNMCQHWCKMLPAAWRQLFPNFFLQLILWRQIFAKSWKGWWKGLSNLRLLFGSFASSYI